MNWNLEKKYNVKNVLGVVYSKITIFSMFWLIVFTSPIIPQILIQNCHFCGIWKGLVKKLGIW